MKFDGVNWHFWNTSNSNMPGNFVIGIVADKSGNIWFGSYSNYSTGTGLVKFDGNNFIKYNMSNSYISSNDVESLAYDTRKSLLIIGTDDKGLCSFDGKNWVLYNTSNSGLISNEIRSIFIDSIGNYWIGTYEGVSYFGKK